jgi:hypothetical protein
LYYVNGAKTRDVSTTPTIARNGDFGGRPFNAINNIERKHATEKHPATPNPKNSVTCLGFSTCTVADCLRKKTSPGLQLFK